MNGKQVNLLLKEESYLFLKPIFLFLEKLYSFLTFQTLSKFDATLNFCFNVYEALLLYVENAIIFRIIIYSEDKNSWYNLCSFNNFNGNITKAK